MSKKVFIIGATSALAHEAAKSFALERADLFLVARNQDRLEMLAEDLKARGASSVEIALQDVSDLSTHEALLDKAILTLGKLDMVLIAHGTLGDQRKCELSVEETMKELNTNALSVISLLTILGNYFERQKSGCIAVISSVAGDRGRKSNYVYGTAKATLDAFLSGLRNRLSKYGVAVVTIKPGTVDTPMTAHLKKGLLFAQPAPVGAGIYQAMIKRKNVVYLPGYWRYIMFVIKSIPEPIFKRLSLS